MDILNEIISLLKRNFPERIQMFSNRGISHDEKLTIYQKDGVIVDWCPYYEYVEILGLPKRDACYVRPVRNRKENKQEERTAQELADRSYP